MELWNKNSNITSRIKNKNKYPLYRILSTDKPYKSTKLVKDRKLNEIAE